MIIDGVVEWDGEVLEGSGSVGGSAESDGFGDLVKGFGG